METNLKRITAEVRSAAIAKMEWVENGHGAGTVYVSFTSQTSDEVYMWTGILERDFLAVLIAPSVGRAFNREIGWRQGIKVWEYEMAS